MHRREGTLPEELEGVVKGRLYDNEENLKLWQNNHKGLRYIDDESGFTLMGALDDLFVTEEELHAPLDFKTRGYPLKEDTASHYQHQMDIYGYLLEKNGMNSTNFAILIFYHPTSVNKKHEVIFNSTPVILELDKNNGAKFSRRQLNAC